MESAIDTVAIPMTGNFATSNRSVDMWSVITTNQTFISRRSEIVLYKNLDDRDFFMKKHIQLEIVNDQFDGVVSSDSIFNVFGVGRTPQESIDNYFLSLIEYYELLEECSKTNPLDKAIFENLSQFINKR